ncbi:MAG: C39 family peptidase [Armatimonadota bacterium]
MNKSKLFALALVSIFVFSLSIPAFADVILGVEFLEQFWNDDTCGKGSCGPASIAMCNCYVLGRTPVTQDIINVWLFLGGDPNGNDPAGTSLSQLVSASHEWPFGVAAVYQTTSTLAGVKSEIAAGNPVLVHVKAGYLSNRGYSYTGGHYIAAVGYNDDYLICNDPGTWLGEHKYYSNADMTKAMKSKHNGVLKGFHQ